MIEKINSVELRTPFVYYLLHILSHSSGLSFWNHSYCGQARTIVK